MKKLIYLVPFVIFVILFSACVSPKSSDFGSTPVSTISPTVTPPIEKAPTAEEWGYNIPAEKTPAPLYYFLEGQAILETLPFTRGYHAVYIHEIGAQPEDGVYYNSDKILHGASTIKIAIAVVTLKVIEEKNLDLQIYSPQIEAMLVSHDEKATDFLIRFVNKRGYKFDDVLEEMGLPDFNTDLRLTTASSLGKLLEGLATDSLGLKHNQYILDLLATPSAIDSEKYDWAINGTLPGTYINKVGFIHNQAQEILHFDTIKFVTNDAGIWTTPSGHRFVLVFLGNYQTDADYTYGKGYIHKIVNILAQLPVK